MKIKRIIKIRTKQPTGKIGYFAIFFNFTNSTFKYVHRTNNVHFR